MKVSLRELYQTKDKEINSLDNGGDDSPSSTTYGSFNFSSSKRSRRAIQKRVVNVPIKDVESSRFKGDLTLPSDSWSWRKYGQKPIKGSPYPRGYYRCSSSKGCPARKQVERSRSDPNMIVITYSHDHNHTWQSSKNHHQNRHTSNKTLIIDSNHNENANENNPKSADNIRENQEELVNTCEEHMEPPVASNMTDEFGWFASMDHHYGSHGDHPFLMNCSTVMSELEMVNNCKIFPIKEEEEELFAGLGELPECSAVFS